MTATTFKQKITLILFGLFLALILLEIGLRAGGGVYLYFQERANLTSLREKGELVIMCLGESTTQAGGATSYPRQLENILNEQGYGIAFTVINKGISGTNSAHIAAGLRENLERYRPDIVITMIGINDGPRTAVYAEGQSVRTRSFLEGFRVYKLAGLVMDQIAYVFDGWKKDGTLAGEETGSETGDPDGSSIPLGTLATDIAAGPGETADDEADLLARGDRAFREGRLEEAGEYFRRAAADEPEQCYRRFVELARTYHRRRDDRRNAEKYYKKAITLQPDNDRAYAIGGDGLVPLYREQGRWDEAEKLAGWVISINPNNHLAHSELGRCYERRGKIEDAVEVYLRSLQLEPLHNQPFAMLTHYFNKTGQYEKAEEICRLRLSKQPDDEAAHAALALTYHQAGNAEMAEEYFARTAALRANYNPPTALNYRTIIETLLERRIQPVAVQYPMRNIDDLKQMLSGCRQIIFVDNEGVFKEALRQGRYDEYFIDQFAGDFGHCTPRGNRLLAENIAAVLAETYFRAR